MRTFIIAITLGLFAFSTALAATGGQSFTIYSAASASDKTSAAIKVSGTGLKTLTVSGVTLTSNAALVTYKNMSGTLLVQCAPTTNGPWSTCVANDYAQTAVSKTTNGTLTWKDAVAYVRLKWTSGTVGTKIKAWLNWNDN